MRTLDDQMTFLNFFRQFLSRFAPQDKRDTSLIIDRVYNSRGEFFPSFVSMGVRLVGTHREDRIEQQHTLPGPCVETSMRRR